jgi:hypothetical protein
MGRFTIAVAGCTLLGACALLGATTTVAFAAAPEPEKVSVEIVWDPATPPPEGRIWMTYLFTRAAFAAREPAKGTGENRESEPTFEEEVRARKMAVSTFRELRHEDGKLASTYFSDVDRVETAGFLREYVWRYLRRDSWNQVPLGLDLTGFDEWRQTELARHVPVTHGSIALKLAAK